MPPPGPGPQPPSDGKPFILMLTMTAKSSEGADELAKLLSSQREWSLGAGAKSFTIGRNVNEHSVVVIEVTGIVEAVCLKVLTAAAI